MSHRFIKTIKKHTSNPGDQSLAKIAEMIHDPFKRANLRTQNHLPLRLACKNGDIPLVKLLLDNGASCRFGDDEPLKLACENGHLEIAELLIARGANVRANRGRFLRFAAKGGHADIVKLLLEHGVRFDAEALDLAISKGYFDVVKQLFKSGIHRWNPAMLDKTGSPDVVQFLLDSGTVPPEYLLPALMSAVKTRNIDIIRILVDHGANMCDLDYEYLSSQHIFYGPEIMALLLDNCPSDKLTRYLAENELKMATRSGYDGDVTHLLHPSVYINHAVMQHVCTISPIESVQQLLKTERSQSYLDMALEGACMVFRCDVVELLIQNGANCPEHMWSEKLTKAMMCDDMRMLTFVINCGAKLGARILAYLFHDYPEAADRLLECKYRFLYDNGCEIFRKACKKARNDAVRTLLQYDPTLARYWHRQYDPQITELFHVYGDEHTLAELKGRLTDRQLRHFEAAKPHKPPKSAV